MATCQKRCQLISQYRCKNGVCISFDTLLRLIPYSLQITDRFRLSERMTRI